MLCKQQDRLPTEISETYISTRVIGDVFFARGRKHFMFMFA